MVERRAVEVAGTIQGVGFRPFIARLATAHGLAGWVRNDGSGVRIEIEGSPPAIEGFLTALEPQAPPLAVLGTVSVSTTAAVGAEGFEIVASAAAGPGLAAVPPDVAPCDSCLAEVFDDGDRRFGYPFTCCTDCGPRYTVVSDLPYDRSRTSMAPFELCERCRTEYADPDDRRFHAQATCCPRCGPALDMTVDDAVALLETDGILAVKGLGGYQLLCRADRSVPVGTLRRRKRRSEKPLAVLVGSIEAARELIAVDRLAQRALTGPEAPIVLAPARPGVTGPVVAAEVAPGTGLLGVMLPSTPLHHLLARGVGVPLVCTSGNVSEEPIVVDDGVARTRLEPIADGFLGHDRTIERRADDSVGQVVNGRFQLLRRARGFAPRPVALDRSGPAVLGVGAELKSTVCLAVGSEAALSVHLGDLENPATLEAFEQAIGDHLSLTGIDPDLVVHDLHPEYLSTKFAASQDLAPTLAVQHHHAHLASCLADNQHRGPAIGITFDGLGWGSDDTAWGGEVLVGDATGFVRAAHLRPVALPGGAAAAREPWRMAVAHLVAADEAGPASHHSGVAGLAPDEASLAAVAGPASDHSGVAGLAPDEASLAAVADLCRPGRSLMTSSMGRLFDAVAALCGIGSPGGSGRGAMSYEGQAAIGLEQLAGDGEADRGYPWAVAAGEPAVVDSGPTVLAAVEDLSRGRSPATVAARFHRSVADLVVELCRRQRAGHGLETVALTGGVFQNRLLVELVVPALESAGFVVLRHGQVPPNDGGISLGQIAIGRAHLGRQ